jgi:hypothetical protein
VLERYDVDAQDYRLLVNPTGRFEIGGPMGDAGLTGRKIIVDSYGGMARHGGGAFSGKDPSKVDRSGAYAMRWVAKNVVAAGLAGRCEVQVAYAIGKAHPVGFYVETFGTEHVPVNQIQQAVLEVFDLRPAAIIRDLDLKRPIFSQVAAYGHFGRELPGAELGGRGPGRCIGGLRSGAEGLSPPCGAVAGAVETASEPGLSAAAAYHLVCPNRANLSSRLPGWRSIFRSAIWTGRSTMR